MHVDKGLEPLREWLTEKPVVRDCECCESCDCESFESDGYDSWSFSDISEEDADADADVDADSVA